MVGLAPQPLAKDRARCPVPCRCWFFEEERIDDEPHQECADRDQGPPADPGTAPYRCGTSNGRTAKRVQTLAGFAWRIHASPFSPNSLATAFCVGIGVFTSSVAIAAGECFAPGSRTEYTHSAHPRRRRTRERGPTLNRRLLRWGVKSAFQRVLCLHLKNCSEPDVTVAKPLVGPSSDRCVSKKSIAPTRLTGRPSAGDGPGDDGRA